VVEKEIIVEKERIIEVENHDRIRELEAQCDDHKHEVRKHAAIAK